MRITDCALYFLDVPMRVPLKFGSQTLTEVTCARVAVRVRDGDGKEAEGWGETPLNVGWVWPAAMPYLHRQAVLKTFCTRLVREVRHLAVEGHALEIGHAFLQSLLPGLLAETNAGCAQGEEMPHLAALTCFSPFDIALHDAFGKLHGLSTYETYTADWLGHDLTHYLKPGDASGVSFHGKYPADFLTARRDLLPVWHLVGGLDPLTRDDLAGDEPADGYPVLLRDWIRQDGLKCLKIKLRGEDATWDYDRLVRIGTIALEEEVRWLTTDFNCTVTDPAYVNDILDRLEREHAEIHATLLYVEQPFPYDLEANQIDVHSVSERKPLFMDESAHDWTFVRLGRTLGWSGVALKTCKTQTGALLSLCWAKAHGMQIMVQDLTNPMLAQIPHVLLAAHSGTIMGVESNGMQFYPEASAPERVVHPRVYRRKEGALELSTIHGDGFGYRLEEIGRGLPAPVVAFGG